MKHVVIIGNGIAGITAARYIRKLSDYRITVISSESEHFWSRTALMYIYMGHMKYHHTKPYEDWFWSKNRIELRYDHVEAVETSSRKLRLTKGDPLFFDILIIASGSQPNRGGWKGEELKGVSTMVSLQDLELIEHNTKNIKKGVVIGGGLIGIELAEMLLSRNIEVTFLVRERSFWDMILPKEESAMVNRHIIKHHINLKLETGVEEIIGNGGTVSAVKTVSGEIIPCEFVGVTIGVKPQISFLKGSGIELDRGVLVDDLLSTNIPGVYAIGDCAQHRKPPAGRKEIEQIWYTGRIQGETVAKIICGDPTPYQPGVFFNSAKFLDIEYQTYGVVPADHNHGFTSFYWQNMAGDKSLRILFSSDEGNKVVGFNLMGIRYRQEVCEQWIQTEAEIGKVIGELEKANFDPEFHNKYEHEIRNAFNTKFPELDTGTVVKRKKVFGLF